MMSVKKNRTQVFLFCIVVYDSESLLQSKFVKLYSQLAQSTSNKNRASSLYKIQIQIRSALSTNQLQNQLCLVAQKNCRKFQKQNFKFKKKKKKKHSFNFQQLFNLSFSSQIIIFFTKKNETNQKQHWLHNL